MVDTMGSLGVIDGKPVLQFARDLPHPPDKVWRVISDPTEMRHWFPAEVQAEQRAGAPMRFVFDDGDVDGTTFAEGEVIEFDPPKVYAFRWGDSMLRFEVVPTDEGCRLIFTHVLSGTGTAGDLPSAARQATGWDGCLGMLVAYLDGRTESLEGAWWFRGAERYIERFGLAKGAVYDAGDGWLLRFDRDLVQSVAEVWTTFMGRQNPAVGAVPPRGCTNSYVPAGRITRVDAPNMLEFQWEHDGVPAGRVRIELAVQEPIGCRLTLTQTVPAERAGGRPTALAAWQTHLELLFAALHGEIRRPWPAERTEELREWYAEDLDRAHEAEHSDDVESTEDSPYATEDSPAEPGGGEPDAGEPDGGEPGAVAEVDTADAAADADGPGDAEASGAATGADGAEKPDSAEKRGAAEKAGAADTAGGGASSR